MICEPTGSDAEDASRPHLFDPMARLHDAVHALAQPLTALAFVLELGRLRTDADGCRSTLDEASAECKRAFQALEHVRDAIHAMDTAGGLKQ